MQAMISKFSDEFGQASNLIVSSESPERVDLKIKNLHTMSKREYRRGSIKPRAVQEPADAVASSTTVPLSSRQKVVKKLEKYARNPNHKVEQAKKGSESVGQGSPQYDRGHRERNRKVPTEATGTNTAQGFVSGEKDPLQKFSHNTDQQSPTE